MNSAGFRGNSSNWFVLDVDLPIRGVTQPVSFDVSFEGSATEPWGNVTAAFIAQGGINRGNFGLEWNAALEAGGVLVGHRVIIELDVQLAHATTAQSVGSQRQPGLHHLAWQVDTFDDQ